VTDHSAGVSGSTTKKKAKPGIGYPTAVVFLLGGAGFLAGGVVTLAQYVSFLVQSTSTTATVVGYQAYPTGRYDTCFRGDHRYSPRVTFLDSTGRKVIAVLPNKGYCSPVANGTTEKIRYDTRNPTAAELPAASNWGPGLAGLGFGVFGTFLGIFATQDTIQKRRAARGGSSTHASDAAPGTSKRAHTEQQEDLDRRARAYVEQLQQQDQSGDLREGTTPGD